MNTNQFSVRLTDEQRTQINEIFPEAANKEILNALLEKFNSKPDHSTLVDELLVEKEALELHNAQLQQKIEDCENSESQQIADLEARQPEPIEKIVEVPAPMGERELRFTVPPLAWALLQEYAERLNTAPQNILIDMFLRYVIEQRNYWFFDFLVHKSEFLAVTGYAYSDVEKWLKSQKQ
ncbi:MAG: hypothetical protein LBB41_06335 [Prevotellaceae bacterium]|jgi:hypothetical protein|nr:hypothetical protein [Prevotellaceae bacterium]